MKAWVCCLALAVGARAFAAAPPASPEAWPTLTQTAKPWTRWWWPGSAVDRAGITHQLEQFALTEPGNRDELRQGNRPVFVQPHDFRFGDHAPAPKWRRGSAAWSPSSR